MRRGRGPSSRLVNLRVASEIGLVCLHHARADTMIWTRSTFKFTTKLKRRSTESVFVYIFADRFLGFRSY